MAAKLCAVRATASHADDSRIETMISELIGRAGHYEQYNRGPLSYFAEEIKRIALRIWTERGDWQGIQLNGDEQKAKVKQRWVIFWSTVLQNCPGPILFEPSTCPLVSPFDFHLDRVPRYLFLTFDQRSSGQSNEEVVASPASTAKTINSKLDIFSLDKDIATAMLERHLNPWEIKDYERRPPVQYALYRRHRYGCTSHEIKICVIDTRLSPLGQFVPARRLLQAYYTLVKRVDMRHHFGTRLLLYIYQNGEYLSQGSINHKGRSCVVSLAVLETSGLYSLYPEFAVPERQAKWAITTAHLRKMWTEQHISSYREIEMALSLAQTCFVGFSVLDIAIILLSFKRRKLKRVRIEGRKPQEVRQYLAAMHVLDSIPPVLNRSTEDVYPGILIVKLDTGKEVIQDLLNCFSVLP
ncbi:hypothetical protein BJY04DRAFT_210357 [Aspergillus karnatakaensis]|uniref:uncharacterized protein n=1 Tax=Aspergillus karnatakaensis TaxID=1810916 RepID=UPI003CCE0DA2